MSLANIHMAPMTLTPPASAAFSPTARFVAEKTALCFAALTSTYIYGQARTHAMEELEQIYAECRMPNWDGYGAQAILDDTFALACQALNSLPLGMPAPTVGAEPDGHITLEWHRSRRRTLSLSISPEGDLHYAALIGANKAYGTEHFFGEMPEAIMALSQRIMT